MTAARKSSAAQTFRGFWHGSALGPYQLLCLRSFVANGHRVEVFSYDRDLTVPGWITRRDAREILNSDKVLHYRFGLAAGSPALHADLFRYALLRRLGGWWIDLDVVMLDPDPIPDDVTVGYEPRPGLYVGNAIMRFPAGHALLAEAVERCIELGENVTVWGQTGPSLMRELVRKHDLARFCRPAQLLYPLNANDDLVALFDPAFRDEIRDRCARSWFLHLTNEIWREAGIPRDLGPPRGSFLDWLCAKHDFDSNFCDRRASNRARSRRRPRSGRQRNRRVNVEDSLRMKSLKCCVPRFPPLFGSRPHCSR